MKFLTVQGKEKNVNIVPYLVDWTHKVSAPQKQVKDFLSPFWKADVILEEFMLPGSRLRADLLNISRHLLVEVSPAQHFEFNKHFHKNRVGYLNSIKRDYQKQKWAEINNFTFVEIREEDMKNLSPEWFKENYNIVL